MPSKPRRPARPRSTTTTTKRNPTQKTFFGGQSPDSEIVRAWGRMMPRGTIIYLVVRKDRGQSVVVRPVFAPKKGEIHFVPPNALIAAGFPYNRELDGVVLGHNVSSAEQLVESLAKIIHGNGRSLRLYPHRYV